MIKSKVAGLAVAGAAAAAVMSVAVAPNASAASSHGCTVVPLKPISAGSNPAGVKLVSYRISVSCSPGRTVSIEQRRYEEDPGADNFLGSTSFNTSGSGTLSDVRTLANTEPGNEEVYHNVRFRVTGGAVTWPWTSYQKSPVLSIAN